MDNEKLLRDCGLNKYEASAYLTLLKEGVIPAGELSRLSNIPMGKIYEVLKTLEDLGFVEVQQSRPKKYRPIDPNVAFDNYYSRKQDESKKEMERLKDTVSRIKEEISYCNNSTHFEKTFWSTIIGEADLLNKIELLNEEVKEELLIVHPRKTSGPGRKCTFTNVIRSLQSNTLSLAGKGIRVKMISPNSNILDMIEKSYASIEDVDLKSRISDYLEIKILDSQSHFVVMDRNMVVINLDNPVHGGPLGIVRIYDRNFAAEARQKFLSLWNKGESFSLS